MPDPRESPDDHPPRDARLMRDRRPGRSGGIIALGTGRRGDGRRRPARQLPAFKKVLALAALDRHPGRHLVLQELIHGHAHVSRRQGGSFAPAPGRGRGAQVPVSRAGPPDPGQSRALRADGPDHRQGRRGAQRQVPHGDRRRPMAHRRTRSTRRTRACSPRCRWRSGRRIASIVCHTLPDAGRPRHARPRAARRPTPGRKRP